MHFGFESWIILAVLLCIGLAILLANAWTTHKTNAAVGILVRVIAAPFFTLHVYVIINLILTDWFLPYNGGWQTFGRWLFFLRSIGIGDGAGNALIGTFLVLSFILAVPLAWFIEWLCLVMRRRIASVTNA